MLFFGKRKKEKESAQKVEKTQAEKPTKTAAAEKTETSKKVEAKETKKPSTKKTEPKTKTQDAKASKPAKSPAKEKAAPAKKALYRVLFDKESRTWLIKKDGAKRTIASFATKEEALSRVKELSSSNDLNFVVHKKDGKFQKKQ